MIFKHVSCVCYEIHADIFLSLFYGQKVLAESELETRRCVPINHYDSFDHVDYNEFFGAPGGRGAQPALQTRGR
jgi:hypothetical protein